MNAVIAQLHVFEQHLPRFARCDRSGLGGFNCHRVIGCWLCPASGLAGKQFLPIQLSVCFAGSPGFKVLAVDLADHDVLLGEIDRGVADIKALKARQWSAIGRIELERRNAGRGIAQDHLGFFSQVQFVVGTEIEDAVFQDQRQGIPNIRPPYFHFAISHFKRALGRYWHNAQRAGPVDPAAFRACCDQGHVSVVVRKRAEVFQLHIHRVIQKLNWLARPYVSKVQIAVRQLDAIDAQRERFAVRGGRCWFAGGEFEQLRQVERAILAEHQFCHGLVELYVGKVQGFGPQAVSLQIGVQAFESDLLLARFAYLQPPQRQLKAERVELKAIKPGGGGGVVGQLLVDDAQTDAGYDQKAEQAIKCEGSQHGANGANQSFGHVRRRL